MNTNNHRLTELKFRLNREAVKIFEASNGRIPKAVCRNMALNNWDSQTRRELQMLKKNKNKAR